MLIIIDTRAINTDHIISVEWQETNNANAEQSPRVTVDLANGKQVFFIKENAKKLWLYLTSDAMEL